MSVAQEPNRLLPKGGALSIGATAPHGVCAELRIVPRPVMPASPNTVAQRKSQRPPGWLRSVRGQDRRNPP